MNTKELREFLKNMFSSYGFEGIRKEFYYMGKMRYLYYFSFSGQWGYSENKYTDARQITEIAIKRRYRTWITCYNGIHRIIMQENLLMRKQLGKGE